MKEIDTEARDRYFKEISIHLRKAGFDPQPQEDGLLSIERDGSHLCRLTSDSGAQYRAEDVDQDGGHAAFAHVTEIAATTAEYMHLMDRAPQLRATGLNGDYRILADFGNAVLAGHPTEYGVQFITWKWSYDRTGVGQGHYYEQNYAGAKQDFAVRAGLIPQTMIFSSKQLDDLYRCCQRTRELDDTLTYEGEQRIIEAQEHIETLAPGVQERVAAPELQRQEQQSQTQSMY